MLCYRVEDNTGYGPYGMDDASQEQIEMMDAHNVLPCADEDFGGWDDDYRFACMTLEQLKSWFGKYFRQLKGYHVGVYESKDVLVGNSGLQIMFRKKTSKFVKRINIK